MEIRNVLCCAFVTACLLACGGAPTSNAPVVVTQFPTQVAIVVVPEALPTAFFMAPATPATVRPTQIPAAPATARPQPTAGPTQMRAPTPLPTAPPVSTSTPAPAATQALTSAQKQAQSAAKLLSLPTAPALAGPVPTRIPATPVADPVSKVPATDSFEQLRVELLAQHNIGRAQAGLPPLVANATLQSVAQLHAEDVARSGRGSHAGSDGSNLQARMRRAGVNTSFIGENWAYTQNALVAWKMWFIDEFPSGPHRLNILRSGFKQVGFGIANGGPYNGLIYIIANFSD